MFIIREARKRQASLDIIINNSSSKDGMGGSSRARAFLPSSEDGEDGTLGRTKYDNINVADVAPSRQTIRPLARPLSPCSQTSSRHAGALLESLS
jgi:hypothetical protein